MPVDSPSGTAPPLRRHRIPFTVIGGFLGAGKTTAVNAIIESAGNRRIAVLVNDFGDLAIDAALIAQRGATTLSLTNGCVCCSLAGGLVQALLDVLALDPPPDHIVVEASGVSDPGRIAQIARADRSLVPDATIVLVAADQWPVLCRDRYVGDTVVGQLAAADFLVLNKLDRVSGHELEKVREQLSALAPHARLLEAVQMRLPYALLLGHAMDDAAAPVDAPVALPAASGGHATRFATRIFRTSVPLPAALLRQALDTLPAAVLRAKGIVCIDEAPRDRHIVQVVGSRWTLSVFGPRAQSDDGSELVVMGASEALAGADLSALSAVFGAAPTSVSWRATSRPDTTRRDR